MHRDWSSAEKTETEIRLIINLANNDELKLTLYKKLNEVRKPFRVV